MNVLQWINTKRPAK